MALEVLHDHLMANPYLQFVDIEDSDNRNFQMLALYYSETDLTQMLMGQSRNYYFEMDVRLVNRFIKLVNEGQRAKSLFQNFGALFKHQNHYIRAISVDSSQIRTVCCQSGQYYAIRTSSEASFVAETCNGDSFVYSLPDLKRIEKQYWEV